MTLPVYSGGSDMTCKTCITLKRHFLHAEPVTVSRKMDKEETLNRCLPVKKYLSNPHHKSNPLPSFTLEFMTTELKTHHMTSTDTKVLEMSMKADIHRSTDLSCVFFFFFVALQLKGFMNVNSNTINSSSWKCGTSAAMCKTIKKQGESVAYGQTWERMKLHGLPPSASHSLLQSKSPQS